MARGSDQSNAQANTSVGQNSGLYGGGQALAGVLAPQLISQSANPQGFGRQGLADITTANEQSAGGGQAGAVGQGALEDSRTRNAGGSGMALAKAARESGKNLSNATLQTNIANEGLKNEQRQTAQKGLEGLYGVDVTGANQAAGNVASNVEANAKQEDASWGWAKNILAPVLGAAGTAAAGGLGPGGALGCWIAEAIYGVDDARTHMLRAWLNGPFKQAVLGSIVMALYLRFGQRIAKHPRICMILKPLFEVALRKALQQHYRDELVLNL